MLNFEANQMESKPFFYLENINYDPEDDHSNDPPYEELPDEKIKEICESN